MQSSKKLPAVSSFQLQFFPFDYIAELFPFNKVPLINTFLAISLEFFHLQ